MFGYVKVVSSELKVKEYEMYRGTYCGLCRSMGKCTGQCSRMALNYDFAFLSLFRIALLGEKVRFSRKRCLVHPLKKRSVMERNSELDFSAFAAALLTYHKIKDDLVDERGIKKLRARLFLPFAAHSRKKAIKHGLDELDLKISTGLSSLSELERTSPKSVDAPAEIFGNILADIVSFGLEGNEERIARIAGKHLGKWIYVTDALDDLKDDVKRKRYNPFLLLYEGKIPTSEELDDVKLALKNELYELESAVDLIDEDGKGAFLNIIKNVIYIGMPETVDTVISGIHENGKITSERKES